MFIWGKFMTCWPICWVLFTQLWNLTYVQGLLFSFDFCKWLMTRDSWLVNRPIWLGTRPTWLRTWTRQWELGVGLDTGDSGSDSTLGTQGPTRHWGLGVRLNTGDSDSNSRFEDSNTSLVSSLKHVTLISTYSIIGRASFMWNGYLSVAAFL